MGLLYFLFFSGSHPSISTQIQTPSGSAEGLSASARRSHQRRRGSLGLMKAEVGGSFGLRRRRRRAAGCQVGARGAICRPRPTFTNQDGEAHRSGRRRTRANASDRWLMLASATEVTVTDLQSEIYRIRTILFWLRDRHGDIWRPLASSLTLAQTQLMISR